MIVKDYKDGKLIILSKAFDTRPKILNSIYFFVFTVGALVFAVLAFSAISFSFWFLLFSLAVLFGYSLAAYRFINKALQTEKLIVTKNNLTIVKTGFLSKKENTYENKLISKFRHLDKPEITRHPLAGDTFDYLGFQTEQQVINDLHGDNRLAFNYTGKTVTFGENIYTWEFDELELLLYDITGNDFRYDDDFEKTFKPDDESQQAT
jgi:hypothetical protein